MAAVDSRGNSMKLQGKVAIVTGASGVLCSEMVRALAAEGCRLALLNRRVESAEALRASLSVEGFRDVMVTPGDVLDRRSLESARDHVLGEWGHIDILINGAGGNRPAGTTKVEQLEKDSPPEDGFFGLDLAAVEDVHRLNLMGTILPSQVFGRSMLGRGGCILNVSSMAANQPLTKIVGYAAAKAGVENFTRWLAVHLAKSDIRVNAIAPGFFITEQNRFLMLEADGKTPTARGMKVLAKTPMGRFGDPNDLRGATVFLCSDDASFITGIVIPVDGGFLAHSGV